MRPGRVLVVDDAPEILNLIKRILSSQGYDVLAAESGPAAIDLFEQANGLIDLLLTDIMMPGMNGVALAEKLLASAPTIPVLFISGQCEESVIRGRAAKAEFRFLAKPFFPQALLEAVRDALMRPEPHRKSAAPYRDSSEKSA